HVTGVQTCALPIFSTDGPCCGVLPPKHGPHSSRIQHPYGPGVAEALVEEALVEAVGAALPELDAVGDEAEAGPVGRARDGLALELLLELAQALHQLLAAREGLALARGPGAELASARAGGEVGVGLLVGDELDRALHAHLLLQPAPVKAKGGPRTNEEVAGLAALQVGVEDEAPPVDVLEQDHAHGGVAVLVGSGQGHRLRLPDLGRARALVHLDEAVDGVLKFHGCLHTMRLMAAGRISKVAGNR